MSTRTFARNHAAIFMDLRTKEIRARETGVTERRHRIRQLIRCSVGICGVALALYSNGSEKKEVMAGAIIASSIFMLRIASEKRTNDTLANLAARMELSHDEKRRAEANYDWRHIVRERHIVHL